MGEEGMTSSFCAPDPRGRARILAPALFLFKEFAAKPTKSFVFRRAEKNLKLATGNFGR